jgi:hypothetical protein
MDCDLAAVICLSIRQTRRLVARISFLSRLGRGRLAPGGRRAVHFCPSRTLIQLHNSFAGGKSGQVGMDDVLLPAPPLDPDAALDPVALLDP